MDEELLPCEEWRPVPGYEGYYDVSSLGRIRSWCTRGGLRLQEPRLRKVHCDRDGYLFVSLYKNHKCQGFRVSRLVLYAFVGIPSGEMEASHIDGNKDNNQLGNLCWETRLDNERRKSQHGTRPCGERNSASRITEADVRNIRDRRNNGETYVKIATEYGMHPYYISLIARGKRWAHIK
jgi:hypothetical protein